MEEHGENLHLHWSPDGTRIVLQVRPSAAAMLGETIHLDGHQTALSYLVLVSVDYNGEELPYQSPPLAPNAARHFLPGAGEALPFQSLSLRLDGVIRIEGTLLRYVPWHRP